MADNRDIAVIKELLIEGLVKGGDDKQAVCEVVKKLRLAKDDKGLKKYLTKLRTERSVSKSGEDSGAVNELTTLIKELSAKITKLEDDNKSMSDKLMKLEGEQVSNKPIEGGQ